MKANEQISGAPRTSIWRSARAKATRTMTIPPSKLAATTTAPKFLSSHRETALCSSLTETHSSHPYCKQTLRHGKLQNAQAGSTVGSSRPGLGPRRPWWHLRVNRSSSGRTRSSHMGGLEVKVDHVNRPISLTSVTTSLLVCMHESEEARLECPLCIGLAPHTS